MRFRRPHGFHQGIWAVSVFEGGEGVPRLPLHDFCHRGVLGHNMSSCAASRGNSLRVPERPLGILGERYS